MITLQPLRWWQLPEVLALEQVLFAPENWSEELFWSELAQGENRSYTVVVDGTELLGYGGLALGGEQAYVQTIGIAPDHQHHGLGARLLTDMLAVAVRRGAGEIGLEVRASNATAQRLYARHGFEAVGRRRGYYQPSGEDALIMVRELS
ncbi:MAG TPA: ribosomal protein S18-alanine N-acetyltransferase [Mycobacteriales bacterium]|jgi:ribosomal-protein-alanine N-acetyltransferase|nr:ribosomal protein S18-alanine N-acetyltransferase [Mycobacteriales bacterium]